MSDITKPNAFLPKAFLKALFDAAVAAADPTKVVPRFLPTPPKGRTLVVGAGKASAAMAQAFEEAWQGALSGPLSGLVVTRYGHGESCKQIEIVEAAHPVPDDAGLKAAGQILELAQGLGPDDLMVALISGGGSALLSLPASGLSFADKQAVNKALLASGAAIGEMNCLRKHLSAIKGGRLAAAAAPARVESLIISDVPGDDPSAIASGPTVADASTREQALAIVAKYNLDLPPAARAWLNDPASETPKPHDPLFKNTSLTIISRPQGSLEAAAALAREQGISAMILGDAIEGEAREVAKVMAGIALQVARHGQPGGAPIVLLSGGETTVTLRGKGRGGRNAEFLLALGVALEGAGDIPADIYALAADTDGIYGSEDNAGAFLFPDSLARARAKGTDGKKALADNDGYGFFASIDDLLMTGPTRTNVNDFRAILVLPRG